MFSVTPELYATVSLVSRWLFVFIALLLLFFALLWHRAERREHKERFKNLPGAGTIGELLVLSGSDQLPPDTWFPVPREGVLGSLRSCDLVIPCPGVSARHLDFSWQDGTGLLIRPHIGCDVLVDGVPVDRRAASEGVPLLHGSVLQVGTGVLRLQVFAALAPANQAFSPAVPVAAPSQEAAFRMPPQGAAQYREPVPPAWQAPPAPVFPPEMQSPVPPVPVNAVPPAPPQQVPDAAPEKPARPKRADRWKEDWSE